MKIKLAVLIALFAALGGSTFAQGIRFDAQVSQELLTTTIPGATNVLTVPANSQIAICNFPANAVPCTNKATTYTTNTLGTPCSTSTQIVLVGTTSCVASPDAQGNWGFWTASGQYAYTITLPGGINLGPYNVTLGISSGTSISVNALTTTGPNVLGGASTITCKQLNPSFLCADQFAGADASAKIQAAITALPSTGGVIVAVNLTDSGGTGSTTIDPGTKAVTVYLGPGIYNFSQVVLRRAFHMYGMGAYPGNGTIIQATGGNAVPPFVIDQGTQATQGVVLRDFALTGTGGNTTQNAINVIAQNGLGLWYSEFDNIFITGFGGIGLNLDGQVNNSANQFDTFKRVVVLRKTNGSYALQIIGFANSLKFENCEFDGQLNTQDGLTNINIAQGTNSVFVPYDITFDLVTVQFAGVGFLINGGDSIVITTGHIENINQVLSVGTGAGFGSLNIVLQNTTCSNNCGIGTTPGVGAGNGAFINNRASAANVSIILDNFHSLNAPDKAYIGAVASISQRNSHYGPEGAYVALAPRQFGQPLVHIVGGAVDTTGLTANVGAAFLYAVPATIDGAAITGAEYRVCGSTTVTTPAGTSSTLPNVAISYTDRDSSVVQTLVDVSPVAATAFGIPGQSTNAGGGNTTATTSNGCIQISAKAGTNINYATSGYASNAANAMAYALHVRLEALDGL